MATDFSFNGQTSYSPILAALAEAPMKNAELKIKQEQNQRQRLSDLLTNMSSAAATARQIQLIHQQGIEQQSREDTAKDLGASGKLYLGNPAYAQSYGGFQGQLDSINKAFPSVPDNTAPSPNGTGQSLNGIGNAPDIQNKLKLGVFGINPTQSSDANTGLTMSNYPGTGGKPTIVNPPSKGELDPVAREYFIKRNDAFSADVKPLNDQILAAQQLKSITSAKIPAAGISTVVESLKAGGLSRINQFEATQTGKDKSLVESARQTAEGLLTGNLTDINQEQIKALGDVLEKSAKYHIDALKSSYINQSMEELPRIGRDRYEKSYSAISNRMPTLPYNAGVYQKGKGLVQGPASVNEVKVGQVYNGHRYKGGDKTKQSSWVKTK